MLECNIDARGKAVRLAGGLVTVGIGLLLALLSLTDVLTLPNASYLVSACFLGGGFAIFEARAGWCALRAMGIKTPL